MLVQGEIRHQQLELSVLLSQLSQLSQFRYPYSRVLLLPPLKRLLAHPQLAANLHRRRPGFYLSQGVDNLLPTVPLALHFLSSFLILSEHFPLGNPQHALGTVFGVWVSGCL